MYGSRPLKTASRLSSQPTQWRKRPVEAEPPAGSKDSSTLLEICCKVDTVRKINRLGDRKGIQAHCWKYAVKWTLLGEERGREIERIFKPTVGRKKSLHYSEKTQALAPKH